MKENNISTKQAATLVVLAIILTSATFLIFNLLISKNISIKTYRDLKKHAEQGKSFNFIFDVTKEPDEKIIDGVLKYNDTITAVNIRKNSISSITKNYDIENNAVSTKRTFYPNGKVVIDVNIVNSNGVKVNSFQRKGNLNKSVFLEVTIPSKLEIPMA